MSMLEKKLQYICLFIWLFNEPVWACSLNFLAIAVSQEVLALYLCVHFFVWFCLVLSACTYVCLCLLFEEGPITSPHWLTHRAQISPLHPLSVGLDGQPIWFSWRRDQNWVSVHCGPAFIPPDLSFTVTFSAGETVWTHLDLGNECPKEQKNICFSFS